MNLFPTITSAHWLAAMRRAKAEPNVVMQQIHSRGAEPVALDAHRSASVNDAAGILSDNKKAAVVSRGST